MGSLLYINLIIQEGRTPLYSASSEGHAEVVQLLLENGADRSIADKVKLIVALLTRCIVVCLFCILAFIQVRVEMDYSKQCSNYPF